MPPINNWLISSHCLRRYKWKQIRFVLNLNAPSKARFERFQAKGFRPTRSSVIRNQFVVDDRNSIEIYLNDINYFSADLINIKIRRAWRRLGEFQDFYQKFIDIHACVIVNWRPSKSPARKMFYNFRALLNDRKGEWGDKKWER